MLKIVGLHLADTVVSMEDATLAKTAADENLLAITCKAKVEIRLVDRLKKTGLSFSGTIWAFKPCDQLVRSILVVLKSVETFVNRDSLIMPKVNQLLLNFLAAFLQQVTLEDGIFEGSFAPVSPT